VALAPSRAARGESFKKLAAGTDLRFDAALDAVPSLVEVVV
jgi:hypothetical protein